MTVFIVQKPRPYRDRSTSELRFPDLSPASSYGNVQFLFSENDQPRLTPGPSFVQARKMLKGFSDDDFLLWAGGDPAGLSIATMIAAAENFGRIKLLTWERNSRRVEGGAGGFYIPTELKVNP
jgi:hypothetical protein